MLVHVSSSCSTSQTVSMGRSGEPPEGRYVAHLDAGMLTTEAHHVEHRPLQKIRRSGDYGHDEKRIHLRGTIFIAVILHEEKYFIEIELLLKL
ncbi:hypothetical protein [Neomegalonema perideroedes]|uniref:hypothetical protein n=1 Tax=Neomegalonema perideroedes TaxID=217219 RepID=UPI0012FE4CBD|nr:hypothetical protein [Neomegalonema perideroedes]